jgi:hypothetical protein
MRAPLGQAAGLGEEERDDDCAGGCCFDGADPVWVVELSPSSRKGS